MNKKGFTLVELLAVIAILAILAIIAIPSILDIFNGAKEDTFRDEVYSVLNAAELAYTKDAMANGSKIDADNNNIYTATELANANLLEQKPNYDYCVKYDAGVITKIAATSAEFNLTVASTKVTKNDIKGATISTGSATVACTE